MAEKTGLDLLRAWMAKTGATALQVAEGVSVTKPVVYSWLGDKYRPSDVTRLALERFTGGAVPAASWLNKEDRDEIKDVQPFVAAKAE